MATNALICSELGYTERLPVDINKLWVKAKPSSGNRCPNLTAQDMDEIAEKWLIEGGNGERYWQTKLKAVRKQWGKDQQAITRNVKRLFWRTYRQWVNNKLRHDPSFFEPNKLNPVDVKGPCGPVNHKLGNPKPVEIVSDDGQAQDLDLDYVSVSSNDEPAPRLDGLAKSSDSVAGQPPYKKPRLEKGKLKASSIFGKNTVVKGDHLAKRRPARTPHTCGTDHQDLSSKSLFRENTKLREENDRLKGKLNKLQEENGRLQMKNQVHEGKEIEHFNEIIEHKEKVIEWFKEKYEFQERISLLKGQGTELTNKNADLLAEIARLKEGRCAPGAEVNGALSQHDSSPACGYPASFSRQQYQ